MKWMCRLAEQTKEGDVVKFSLEKSGSDYI
jgi:hypothetical protein